MAWQTKTQELFEHIHQVFKDLADYLPLTLRQVYYQLVANSIIENNRSRYQRLSTILIEARIQGLISWTWLEDRTRNVLESPSFQDKSAFLAHELRIFLLGYRKDLLQGQQIRPEVWIEKDALSHVAFKTATRYSVLVAPAKGFSSISYLHEFRQRALENAKNGQRTKILYFGDLDPSGWTMLPSMLKTLHEDFGLKNVVHAERIALTPAQVVELDLPNDPTAMKKADNNLAKYQQWLRDNGHPDTLSVELDALPPATLEQMIREAIEANLDMSLFDQEQAKEEAELRDLTGIKDRAVRILEKELA